MKQSILIDKSKAFALRIIKLSEFISSNKINSVLAIQILRSGTSIGANIHEALYAQSKADFISKLSISLKETSESGYWLNLLYESGSINSTQYESISSDCDELRKILSASIKTAKTNKMKNEVQEPDYIYKSENVFDPIEEFDKEITF